MTEVRFQLALYVHLHRVDAIQDRLLERAAIAGAERSSLTDDFTEDFELHTAAKLRDGVERSELF